MPSRTTDWRRLTPDKIASLDSYERDELTKNALRNYEAIKNDRALAADVMKLERVLQQLGVKKDASGSYSAQAAAPAAPTRDPLLDLARTGKADLDAQYEAAAQRSAAQATNKPLANVDAAKAVEDPNVLAQQAVSAEPKVADSMQLEPLDQFGRQPLTAATTGPLPRMTNQEARARLTKAPAALSASEISKASAAQNPDVLPTAGSEDPWDSLFSSYKTEKLDPMNASLRSKVAAAGAPAPVSVAAPEENPIQKAWSMLGALNDEQTASVFGGAPKAVSAVKTPEAPIRTGEDVLAAQQGSQSPSGLRAVVQPSVVAPGMPPLKLTPADKVPPVGPPKALDRTVSVDGAAGEPEPWLKSLLADAGVIDEGAWAGGDRTISAREVQTPPLAERSEYFITQTPKPTDDRSLVERGRDRDLDARLRTAIEQFGRRSAGYLLQPTPELTTPKLYGMNQFEKAATQQELQKAEIQRGLEQRGLDRSIAAENRIYQRGEQLRDNIRAIERQLTDIATAEAQLGVNVGAYAQQLQLAGFPPAEIQKRVAQFEGTQRKALGERKASLRDQLDQTRRLYGSQQEQQERQPPADTTTVSSLRAAPVPQPPAGASVIPTPSSAGSTGAPRAGGQPAPKTENYQTIGESRQTLQLGGGRTARLKPQFASSPSDIQKRTEEALTFRQSLEATEGIEKLASDLFNSVDALARNGFSAQGAADVEVKRKALKAAIANASGKALKAEGLSGTVASLEQVEHALDPGDKATLLQSVGAVVGGGTGLQKAAFDAWMKSAKASLNSYRQAVEHARDTWLEQYTEGATSGAPAKGGSGKLTLRNKATGETKPVSPNVAKSLIEKYPTVWEEVR